MKRRLSLLPAAAVLACLLAGSAAHAGGPITVNRNAQPFVWDNTRPIRYTVDPGPLGRIPNTQAVQWVAEAFARWASVEGAALTIQATPPYPKDITAKNVLEVLNTQPDDMSLIIFDKDGSILNMLFGQGWDARAGIGGIDAVDVDRSTIKRAQVILNGTVSESNSAGWFRNQVMHEVGHFLGLYHSQLNRQVEFDGDATNDHLAPCMSYSYGYNAGPSLHLEDRAWLAALYPRPGAPQTTGTIHGRVLLPDGKTGLQGIQVIARRDGDEEVTAVSGISGYRYKGTFLGSYDVALQGYFELPGLPPGNYRLAIEPLAPVPDVKPLHAFLPGGRRFWRDSGPLATLPEDATLVSVRAGDVLATDFVLDGPSSPPREVAAVTPNYLPEIAQTVALPAVVTGRVAPGTPASWYIPLPGGVEDRVEAWHRIVLTEPTTLSATLTTEDPRADLNLYLCTDRGGHASLSTLVRSAEGGTPPETFQTRLLPGVYFVGVSSDDNAEDNPECAYRLTLLGVPSPDPPAANPPRITLATISNLMPTSMRVSWQTDQDANSVLWVSSPERELGSPAFTREHSLVVTGLVAGTYYQVIIIARNERDELGFLPRLLVSTPSTASGSRPRLAGGLWSVVPQGEENDEYLILARVANTGDGPATRTRIERLALPPGWRFAAPPALPLDLGEIGSASSALLAVRALRDAAAAPPDLILEGSYAAGDGSVHSFGGS
jgi:hypothetical protein